tara:strand:- start:1367 stop:2458 length:1092 start_codon:yes stop_codon:yes gene_type:complete
MKLSKRTLDENYMRMAFDKAFEHLGSTKNNPSVGCIVVKNNSVISSGKTSLNGRPHAEVNALSKNLNFKGSTLYVTLEPCIHYGETPPCVNIIKKKGIKKVYYSVLDPDHRTFNKAKNFLNKSGIKVNIGLLKKKSLDFYKSYFQSNKLKSLPYTDIKIAISKDYYSVDKKNKWITNSYSRNNGHLIRSKYDCILSTYKSVNSDNSLLNCRIKGLENLSPSRAIIDQDLKLNKNLKLFTNSNNIPTYIITCKTNKKKEDYLKSKKIKLIKINKVNNSISYEKILMELKKKGFSRVLCELGSHTASSLLKSNLVSNIYVYMSQNKLGKNGKNSFKKELSNLNLTKKKRIKVNLNGDNLYKFKIK